MAAEIEFIAAAREDFDEGFDWYRGRSLAAALGFAAEIDAAIERIGTVPERFPTTYAGCRYCRLVRYPYSVVYYRSTRGLLVVAVAHAKRRPGYWRQRLTDQT